MYAWALALIALALVAGVFACSVMAATAEIESRTLAIGFLVFFVASLAASAGLLPIPSLDEPLGSTQSAYLTNTNTNTNPTGEER